MKTILLSLSLVASPLGVMACGGYGDWDDSLFIAHEWGTFTSLQGSDGVQFEWRPGIGVDLPKFVYTHTKPDASVSRVVPASFLAKPVQTALQRMETPVIYFYSCGRQTVDVRVNFPNGTVTEWYPKVTSFGPQASLQKTRSFIEWNGVQILPNDAAKAADLIQDGSRSHYFEARSVDANTISFPIGKDEAQVEREKFLFYRGLGHFKAPLEVTQSSDGAIIRLHNTGTEPLRHLRILSTHNNKGQFSSVDELAAGATKEVSHHSGTPFASTEILNQQLGASLENALTSEGLFAKEAAALVNTWRDSWFEEPGLRVLYLLPREWTDRVLPLDIKPAPARTVRVMVGRAELLQPAIERKLYNEFSRFKNSDRKSHTEIANSVNRLGFGRFLEPALFRSIKGDTDPESLNVVQLLLAEVSKLPKATNTHH